MMSNPAGRVTGFRKRLLEGETLIGTFVKTPHPVVVEILGLTDLDCICLDAEHAPFDRASLDIAILAARANDMPSLIRLPRTHPADVLTALDLGATGILLPHIVSAAQAAAVAASARYGGTGRGYAGSTRAARYATRSIAQNVAEANAGTVVVAQIEDAAALEQIDAIAQVDGIDCLFIGRMDLTISLGLQSAEAPPVLEAVRSICEAGRRYGRAVGMFTSSTAEAKQWQGEGASFFLLGSDQQFLLLGGRELAASFRAGRVS